MDMILRIVLLTSSNSIFLQVGINIFVTGGIGGVHRHGENSKYIDMHNILPVGLSNVELGFLWQEN